MSKRMPAPVPEEPCRCPYLEDAAANPAAPIKFNSKIGAYYIVYEGGSLSIHYCPLCGRAAPEHTPSWQYARIPDEEVSRLTKLRHGIETIDDAIQRFGKPDYDETSTRTVLPTRESPPKTEQHRHIRYYNLSDFAYIWITEFRGGVFDGEFVWHLQSKFLKGDA
jgi:hypothetical protein